MLEGGWWKWNCLVWFGLANVKPVTPGDTGRGRLRFWEVSLCSPPSSTHRVPGGGNQRPRAQRRPHGTLTTALCPAKTEHKKCWPTPHVEDASNPARFAARHLTSRHSNSHAEPIVTPAHPDSQPWRDGQLSLSNAKGEGRSEARQTTGGSKSPRPVP